MPDNRLPREKARDTSRAVLLYMDLWKCYYDDATPYDKTREIRMDSDSCVMATHDIFGLDPSEAEIMAVSEAFYWMPAKQAWNLTKWLIEHTQESHEKFNWLRERAAKERGG